MHSDSSDDENLDLLKEAQDNDFLSDSLFKNPKAHLELAEDTSKKLNASLRKCTDENEQFNTFGVTPEFQKYIGKHLSAILDQKLEKIEFQIKETVVKEETQADGGIKLFSNSSNFLDVSEHQVESNIKKLKKSKKHFDNILIDKEDLKNIVVSGEAIQQKKDLKYWSKRTKGKVFYYKQNNNGQLMLVE